jgi:hypothetical protein
LLFGYLARPGEHAIATRLLAGVRFFGLIAASAAVSGGALIGSGDFLETPVAIRDELDCRPDSHTVGPPGRRREVLRDLDCTLVRKPEAEATVKDGAQDLMDTLVKIAGGSSGLLVLGALVNVGATSTARRRADKSNPIS